MTKIIGLTGGLASGKSTVARVIRGMGIPVIDADKIAREVVKPRSKCWKKIRNKFGKGYFKKNGQLNRKRLAELIFSNPKKRRELEKITHPEILKRINTRIKHYKKQKKKLVVVEAALLFETGLHEIFKPVIVVWADKKTQIKRLMKRDKISRREATRRINSQIPLSKKRAIADYVINNSGKRLRDIG